ncbi:MAG: zinc dependent phospholipase C family protein [Muricoprocola sp.]
MPSIYAHERFGSIVSGYLNKEMQAIIENHPSEFHIGLQGPDIFFFYKGWSGNAVTRYGAHLHDISAKPFFEHGRKVVRHYGRCGAEYAYLLGFICHYTLDSECHGYVEEMVAKTGVNHVEIEEEFDKFLLRKDGIDAVSFPAGDLIPTDIQCAEAAAVFYSRDVDASLVRACFKDMKMIKRIFTAPCERKQNFINQTLKRIGRYEELKGHMYQMKDNPKCKASNAGLDALFEQSIPVAVSLMEQFDISVCTGSPLGERFNRNFE